MSVPEKILDFPMGPLVQVQESEPIYIAVPPAAVVGKWLGCASMLHLHM